MRASTFLNQIFSTYLFLFSCQALAQEASECFRFIGSFVPSEVHEIELIGNRQTVKFTVYQIAAKNKSGATIGTGNYVCQNKSDNTTVCSADDDAGSFMISWSGGYSLQSTGFSIESDDENRIRIKSSSGLKKATFEAYGKQIICHKDEDSRSPSGSLKDKSDRRVERVMRR